jgi:hypothetical protein
MAFHVEVGSSALRQARAFNLDPEELRRDVLEPWLAGRPVHLGDREWLPRESSLRVIEGPRLEGPDLAFGQGWSNAERGGRDVTREVLTEAEREAPPPPVAMAIEAEDAEQGLAALAAGAQPRELGLAEAAGAVASRDPRLAALILVTRPSPDPREPRS